MGGAGGYCKRKKLRKNQTMPNKKNDNIINNSRHHGMNFDALMMNFYGHFRHGVPGQLES